MRFEHEGHKYEEVRTIPRGYEIWNIGNHAPPGYIPLCRLKAIQPFEGCREIEPDTLKAIKAEGAEIIMQAAGRLTKDTPETWRRYIKRYENSAVSVFESDHDLHFRFTISGKCKISGAFYICSHFFQTKSHSVSCALVYPMLIRKFSDQPGRFNCFIRFYSHIDHCQIPVLLFILCKPPAVSPVGKNQQQQTGDRIGKIDKRSRHHNQACQNS